MRVQHEFICFVYKSVFHLLHYIYVSGRWLCCHFLSESRERSTGSFSAYARFLLVWLLCTCVEMSRRFGTELLPLLRFLDLFIASKLEISWVSFGTLVVVATTWNVFISDELATAEKPALTSPPPPLTEHARSQIHWELPSNYTWWQFLNNKKWIICFHGSFFLRFTTAVLRTWSRNTLESGAVTTLSDLWWVSQHFWCRI